jgi:hypothetical protein
MRRLVSIPAAALASLLIASTAFASICGNDSKPADNGQHSELWVDFTTAPPTITVVNGTPNGHLRGGFADVYLISLPTPDGPLDCFIDDTFIMSEHKVGHIAPGQLFEGLGIIPAVHRGNDPGGTDSGVGFADQTCEPAA